MFERTKVTKEIFAVSDDANLNRIVLLQMLPNSVMDAAVVLIKREKASPADAATFALTLALNLALKADPTVLMDSGVSPQMHSQNIAIISRAAESAIGRLMNRGGNQSMIVMPEEGG